MTKKEKWIVGAISVFLAVALAGFYAVLNYCEDKKIQEWQTAIEAFADLRGQIKQINERLHVDGEKAEKLEAELEDVIIAFEATKKQANNKYLVLELKASITSSIKDGICVEYIMQIDEEIRRLKSE